MIIALPYIVLLLVILASARRLPTGPFLLANAYYLFLTLPCAMAFYYLFSIGPVIDYGSYDLNLDIYLMVFWFQAATMLVAYMCYRSGYLRGLRHPTVQLLQVKVEAWPYKTATLLMTLLSVGTLLYVHFKFGFEFILEPRRLYEASREGFGTHYFLLGLSLRLAALLLMMSDLRRKWIYFVALLVFSVLTGAKINTYIILMFGAMYYIVFLRAGRINIGLIIKLGLIALPLVYLLIYLTFQDSEYGILQLLVAYVNEPWNNFILLVQSYHHHFQEFFGGMLTFENNVISRIPRPLYPEKPYLFGGFRLANAYFPETVALGIGAPSFGTEGIVYADWGVFGLFLLALFRAVQSYYLGRVSAIVCQSNVRQLSGNFLYFGILLILADLYFFTLPPSNNMADNLITIVLLSLVFGIRRVRSFVPATAFRLTHS